MDIPSPARIMVELQKGGHAWPPAAAAIPTRATRVGDPVRSVPTLHTTGRRSGQPRQTPLSYTKDGDTYVVIASDGGSPRHPDWYLDLQADADAEIEVGGRARGRAETVTGDERDRCGAQPCSPTAATPGTRHARIGRSRSCGSHRRRSA